MSSIAQVCNLCSTLQYVNRLFLMISLKKSVLYKICVGMFLIYSKSNDAENFSIQLQS